MHIQSTSLELTCHSSACQEAQELLKHSEERFRALVANIPGAVYCCVENGQIQGMPLRTMAFISEAIYDISGYPPSDFINNRVRTFTSIIHPQDRASIEQAVWESIIAKQPYVIEYRIIRADGSIAWVYDKGQVIFTANEEEEPQGMLRQIDGIILDITERKRAVSEATRATDALRESEAHYRRILETASEGIWMFDANNKTTFANDRIAEMLGYTVEEMLGRSLFDFMDEQSCTLAAGYIERRRQGIPERHDFKFRRLDGSDLWAIVSATPILDSAGQFIGVLRMITDISDRKRTEEQLQQSEQRFRATFAQAPVGIAHVDLDGNFLRINQKFCHLVGYTQEEMLARNLQDITHPEDLQADLNFVRQVLSGEIQMYSMEKRYITRRDEVVWINLTVSLRRRSSGEPKYFILVVQDISERKQAEKALQQSERELKAKNQQLQQTLCQLKQTQAQLIQNEKMVSLGQMVAGIAHEINNPIGFIYGNISYAHQYASDLLNLIQLYAKHYPEPGSEIQNEINSLDLDFLAADFPKVLNSMKEGSNRIREIVLSLRNFSRLDEADLKQVDIHEGIDNTLLILQHRLKKQPSCPEIQVRKEYGQLPMVECYPGQLNQVFMNLLSNAIDALETCPYPRIITIRTEVKDEGENIYPSHVVIRIADNGPGIAEDVKKHIFDPFFTTKPVGVGTGLGLSISHSIVVEKHSGQLRCNSALGQGAEFVIELPVQQKQQK